MTYFSHPTRVLLTVLCTTAFGQLLPAQAQITPDGTLGNETSTVTSDALVQGAIADLIEGGAIRSGNLFHSFLEFNIDQGQRVYFANPEGIESILSRITGGDPSNIFGTLGVDGTADLFLINPNGIVFGETAALDIEGSFYATTAEAIPLGDGVYSATAPEQSSLLTVNPSAVFSSYLNSASGDIENRGQLAAQGNMTLAANRLDLQGQVAAGGDLTLLGIDEVQIRDTAEVPFIGFAGGDLLVQGNEQVDIVALSHADSGLYSYGDMVLRSANPVGGDAHYWSGGGFRVETLDRDKGELFSPIDPIIRTLGDVTIGQYNGSSLHILAGESVTINSATITTPDPGMVGIDFLEETVELSDGTKVIIDGSARPTLDVRAGVLPQAIGEPPLEIITSINSSIGTFDANFGITKKSSSGDITIGDVMILSPNGLVFLTNQYNPNFFLHNGSIYITGEGPLGEGINVEGGTNQGGAVYLDSRNTLEVINSHISTEGSRNVGDIILAAGDMVRFDGFDGSLTGAFSNIAPGGNGNGGDIRITATTLEIINGAQLNAFTFGVGNAGNITLNITETARFDGGNVFSSGALSGVGVGGEGNGGDINLTATNLEVTNSAQIGAAIFGKGNAGNVILNITETAYFDGVDAFTGSASSSLVNAVVAGGEGNGGNIELTATNLDLTNGAQIAASTFGKGDAGDVIIRVIETARFDGVDFVDGIGASGLFSSVESGGEGQGGNIELSVANLEITNGAQIFASTLGIGNAGNVVLKVLESARFDGINLLTAQQSSGILSIVVEGAEGRGGDIELLAKNLEVTNGAQITAATFGVGDAGNVTLEVAENIRFEGVDLIDGIGASGAFSSVESNALGSGGNIKIFANNLDVIDGAELSALTSSIGDAGDVIIRVIETARFVGVDLIDGIGASGAFSSVEPGGEGRSGNVDIFAESLEISSGGVLSSISSGTGDAGNILLTISNRILLDNGTISTSAETASGGQVNIQANHVILINDGDIQSFVSSGIGEGGNITTAANFIVALEDSDILAFSADGRGGNIDLSQTTLFSQNLNLGSVNLSREELFALDGNGQVDINASGGIASGQIFINDSSFVENSLTNLEETLIDTTTLTAGSCIARTADDQGSFTITGRDGLPQRPDDSTISAYPTGTVQMVESDGASLSRMHPTGGTLQEPDGVYQLPDGRLVLSRECD